MEKISIILPVYNVEPYLDKCLDSIISQSYQDIELLIVDDGSYDDSYSICAKWQKKYPDKIKLFHQENKGLSAARNLGIENSTGEYIAFVDSDDKIERNMLERLYHSLEEKDADISICGFYEVYDELYKKIEFLEGEIGFDEACRCFSEPYGYKYIVVWNKLYRKKIFESIRFPVGQIHEDQAIIHKLFYKAKKIVTIEDSLYYHINRSDNITATRMFSKHRSDVDFLFKRVEFFKRNGKEYLIPTVETHMFSLLKYYFCNFSDKNERFFMLKYLRMWRVFMDGLSISKKELRERKKFYNKTKLKLFLGKFFVIG